MPEPVGGHRARSGGRCLGGSAGPAARRSGVEPVAELVSVSSYGKVSALTGFARAASQAGRPCSVQRRRKTRPSACSRARGRLRWHGCSAAPQAMAGRRRMGVMLQMSRCRSPDRSRTCICFRHYPPRRPPTVLALAGLETMADRRYGKLSGGLRAALCWPSAATPSSRFSTGPPWMDVRRAGVPAGGSRWRGRALDSAHHHNLESRCLAPRGGDPTASSPTRAPTRSGTDRRPPDLPHRLARATVPPGRRRWTSRRTACDCDDRRSDARARWRDPPHRTRDRSRARGSWLSSADSAGVVA
jgi:hypothetical protein